ncbi:hypothetical protein [Sinorhizobium meliloti]|uniref:hypothetical protein n=1 Tax=Rhizobium meliloti TaxID=382 RepID=UPI00028612C2|nr:hypothetical protein [Sinorhizobium meliloti]ASP77717.1 hypothetical protein CDO27_06890 [Sinorhizobium meliloti]MQW16670.1 hypothetical protein [Sinorhizobium meliloti]CCM68190.1 hypothetical protein BN406_02145 [Sinorhizobium meliloti Rm41]
MTMSPDFANALESVISPEAFRLVSPRDLLQSSPDFLLSLSVIDLFRTAENAAAISLALVPVFEDLDEQVTFATEMVRAGLVTIARLFGEEADPPSMGKTEALETACQQFTQDSVRLSTLLILRDTLTVPAARTTRASATNGQATETVHPGNTGNRDNRDS